MNIQEFLDKFEGYIYDERDDAVIIHPGTEYGFYCFKKEFIDSVKKDLKIKLLFASNGIDDLDPTTQFVIELLRDSY